MKQTIRHPYNTVILYRVFCALCATLLTVSCTNDVNVEWSKVWLFRTPHYLGVSERTCNFNEAEGGTKSIRVRSTNTPWEVTGLPTWLSVDKRSGTEDATINVTCEANASVSARAALLTIRSTAEEWEYGVSVSVSQVRVSTYATPENSTVTFDGAGGNRTVAVKSNVTDWTVSVPTNGTPSWLTAEKSADGSSVVLTASPNPNSTSRRTYVTISTSNTEQQITVDQRPGSISATLERLTFSPESSSKTVTVTADAPWTAQTASSWIDVQPASAGAGTYEVTVRVLANNSDAERSGYIYFVMADDNKVELPVSQEAITFSLSETTLDFGRKGEEKTVIITTNAEWELASDLPAWLTLSATDGNGTTVLSVTAKENESTSARNVTLSFKPKAVGTSYDLFVTQSGQSMNLDITPLQFTNKGGSLPLSFEATGNWTAVGSASWISVTPSSGSGSTTCIVTAEENLGEARTGELVVSFYDATYRIPVFQQAPFMTLSAEDVQFGSTGGTLWVDITSNTHWTTSVSEGNVWLSVSPETGEASGQIAVTAADNPSSDSREGKVGVASDGLPTLLVAVAQAARYLTLNTISVEFLASGGTSELIVVNTDGTFEITTDADWVTINTVSEKSFTLTATKNNSSDERTALVTVSLTGLVSGEVHRSITVTQSGDGFNEELTPDANGIYHIRTKEHLVAFSKLTQQNGSVSAVMDNDIDLEGIDFEPICFWGGSNDRDVKHDELDVSNPFCGTFDGQYHRIKNMILNFPERNYVGLFSIIGGGAVIKNVTIDKSCSVTGARFAAGLIGAVCKRGKILIENCGNEASVTTEDQNAGGILGVNMFDLGELTINNCYNTGNITGGTESAGLSGWLGYNASVSNSYNSGVVVGIESDKTFARFQYSASFTNCYDLYGQNADGITSFSEAQLSNGNLCFLLNGSTSSNQSVFRQNIGEDSHPVLDPSHKIVYMNDNEFSNTEGGGTDDYAYVDLGLPSGLLWATCNVGADNPEDYGDYFAWGETTTKTNYIWSTYQWCNGSRTALTRYNTDSSYGTVDNKTVLDLSDDAARANWGSSWRMATKDEWQELKDNCTWTWTTQGGHTGLKVTSKSNGNYIFLPAAGGHWDLAINDAGGGGYYWSSSLDTSRPYDSWCVCFDADYVNDWESYHRSDGRSVRPVCQPYTPFFEISKENLFFTAAGGTEDVTLTTNLSWTATASESWIKLSNSSGSGNATLSVTAEESTASINRSGIITLTAGGNAYTITVTQITSISGNGYLTFEALENTTFTFSTNDLQYSLNSGATWTTLTAGTATPTVQAGDRIMWKASGLTPQYPAGIGTFSSTGKFNAEGNVMSLLYGDSFADKASLDGYDYAFLNLLSESMIVNAEKMELPATTLAESCYYQMFYDCRSLTAAPALPATTLADGCYNSMFFGCSSLTAAPALPATTLAYFCYGSMFACCTSLTDAPTLPATTLAGGCYYYMFMGCPSLTDAPALPTTTLAEYCYNNMFNGCTSLTTAPELPAKSLVSDCYSYMFLDCENLNQIKCLATDISATNCTTDWVKGVAESGLFIKDASMNSWTRGDSGIPIGWTVQDYSEGGNQDGNGYLTFEALENTTFTFSTNDLQYSLNGGATWTTLTAGTATPTVQAGDRIMWKASGLTPQTEAGIGTFSSTGKFNAEGNVMSLLYGDSFADKASLDGYDYAFARLFEESMIVNAEKIELPATTLAEGCYAFMFNGCTSLITAPALPATALEYLCYGAMFRGCTSLTAAPSLPATTLANRCYGSMFLGCSSLTAAPALPATTLADLCYMGMFENCTSLTTSPDLPATTLAIECYFYMFNGCKNLNQIKCLATDISANACTYNWVKGVAESGLFIKDASMNSWTRGESGIPVGWTVQDYPEGGHTVDYEEEKEINGHFYVDLALPSGLLWATRNVGANSPEGYGDYFAWGETMTKSNFSWNTYKWCNGSEFTQTKYNINSSYGTVDNKRILDLEDDAAGANWGGDGYGKWRMPSHEEWDELRDNCSWTWTTLGGHNGYKVTSNVNGKSIFLPAAGDRLDTDLNSPDKRGCYWSLSLYEATPNMAWGVEFHANGIDSSTSQRHFGQSIRPVCHPSSSSF